MHRTCADNSPWRHAYVPAQAKPKVEDPLKEETKPDVIKPEASSSKAEAATSKPSPKPKSAKDDAAAAAPKASPQASSAAEGKAKKQANRRGSRDHADPAPLGPPPPSLTDAEQLLNLVRRGLGLSPSGVAARPRDGGAPAAGMAAAAIAAATELSDAAKGTTRCSALALLVAAKTILCAGAEGGAHAAQDSAGGRAQPPRGSPPGPAADCEISETPLPPRGGL